ncbi:zinc finger protein 85-like [Portunus trituberculatus]|uniref:zinc finger protein 85-like n=1 Tax=Portunus trituberculatus TaxID=210409 RepID=UPI001E1D123F|nr:zinc finger protein 85-like [Portunus trituberculatus]
MLNPSEDTDAQTYFTPAEWNCMVTIEKNRVTNMLRNYKCLLAQGIDTKPPDFILRYKNRKKQQVKMEEINQSQMSFMQSPAGNVSASWELSLGTYWPAGRDSLSPHDTSSMKENMAWGNESTNCDENCSDFCQYCYIFKHLKYGKSASNSLSSENCCMNNMSNEGELPPLKLSNSLTCNCYLCNCQFPVKRKRTPCKKQQQTMDIYCEECGQTFAKLKYLKNHLKRFSISTDNRPYKCMFCSHSFAHEKNRKFHERIHGTSKVIPCCHCAQNFANLSSARLHIERNHRDKIHACNECGMSYSNSSHLMRHKREVRKQYYPHQCRLCGHRYLTAIALARHEIHHSREKPYRCKTCLKTFSSKTHLTKHLNARTTERKYECPSCKVKFLAYKSLKKHERVFNSNRPFKCAVCGHAYNSKPRLTIHMKVHYREQTYIDDDDENCVAC